MKRQVKKWVTVFSMLMIVLATILPSVALAEDSPSLADGEYTIGFTFLKDGTNEASVMDGYTEKPAKLLVEDGEYELHLTLTNSDWIQEFKVEQNGAYVDAEVIDSDTDANTRIVAFPIEDLDEKVNASTHVVVTGIPGFEYDNHYIVQLQLDRDSLDPPPGPTEPGDGGEPGTPGTPSNPGEGEPGAPDEPTDPGEGSPGTPEEPSTPEEPELPLLDDGVYTISYSALHAVNDTSSSMDGRFTKPATLLVEEGSYYVSFVLANAEHVTGLELQQLDGTWVDFSENDYKVEEFEIASLAEVIDAKVSMRVPLADGTIYENTQSFRIAFDPETVEESEQPSVPEEPAAPAVADGEYTLGFTFLKDGTNEVSVMDGYTEKPAKLLVEDGEYELHVTVTNSEWMKEFKVEQDGDYVDADVINTDVAADTRVVGFPIEDLDEMINISTHVVVTGVPGFEYDNHYIVQLQLDRDSLEPVDGESPTEPGLEDGTYDLNYTAIHAVNDTPSSMDGRFTKPATLLVDGGNYYVSFVLAETEHVTGLELQQADGTWSDFSENDYKVEEFEIASLSDVIEARVSMRVPLPNGTVYENTQPFRIVFDQAHIVPRIPVVLGADGSAPLNSITRDTRVDTSYEGTSFSIIVPAGSQSLSVTNLELTPDEVLLEITVGGLGTREVTLILPKPTGLSSEEVGAFHQNGSIWEYREARVEGDQVYVQTDLSAVKLAEKVDVPAGLAGDASGNRVTLQWDPVAGATYELKRIESGTETVIDNITAGLYSENLSYSSSYSYQVRAVKAGHQSAWSPATAVTTEAAPSSGGGGNGGDQTDGEYTINYLVLKDGTNETSIMQDYTVRPAKLTEQNGRQYITITLKNSSWIPVFRVDKNGGNASVVSRNNSADTRDVRFEVYDLSKDVDVYTEVNVPALNYSGKYDVQFRFDESSIKRGFTQKPVTSNPPPNGPGKSETEIKADKGGTVKFSGAEINIPKDAFARDLVIAVEKVTRRSNLPLPAQTKFVSDVLEITKNRSGNFSKAVTIAIPYDKKEVDFDKVDLAIYWLNERTDEWVKLDNVRIDRQKGIVSGDVDHFTKFAVLATEKQADEEPAEETEQPGLPQQPGQSVELLDIRGHWAEEAIRTLVEAGAIQGYGNGEFRPNHTVTRAEFAKILVEAFDLTADTEVVFPDTAQHWAREAVAIAAGAGIVTGYSEERFGPNDRITREQMAVMIARALNANSEQAVLSFVDAAQIAPWAKEAVAAAVSHEIIQGYPGNRFAPKGQATRAEAVTVIVKALQLEEDETPSKPERPEEPAEPEQSEEQAYSELADGEYEIGFTFFKDGTNEVSVMDGYTEKPATLSVENGEYELHLTLTNSSWTKEFKVEQNGTYVDARVVTSDSQADTRVVAFPIADLDGKINVFTHVIVTGIPGFNYDNEYTVQLELDRDSVDPVS